MMIVDGDRIIENKSLKDFIQKEALSLKLNFLNNLKTFKPIDLRLLKWA